MATKGNLLSVLEDIKKDKDLKVDEDTVMTGDEVVETVSTGSIIIDKLLGRESNVGGVGKGRIVEIYGLESSGKCISAASYVSTDRGLETVAEVFTRNDVNPSCTNKEVQRKEKLINEKGELENTTHFTCNNRREVFEIETRTGNKIEATFNHPLRIIDKKGFVAWKVVGEIETGDYLVVKRPLEKEIAKEISIDEAYEARLLGYLIADGCFHSLSKIDFSNSDPEVINNFNIALINQFKVDASKIKHYPKKDSRGIDHELNSVTLCPSYYKKYEISSGTAHTKAIPYKVRTNSYGFKRIFIQSYMDLESYLDLNKWALEVSSASKELLFQLKLLLQNDFGIISFLNEKYAQLEGWEKPETYYRLTISGKDFDLYLKKIGFGISQKNEIDLQKLSSKDTIQTNHDSIPNVNYLLESLFTSLSFSNRKICSNFFDYMGEKAKAGLTRIKWNEILDNIKDDGDFYIKGIISSYFEKNYYFDEVYSKKSVGEKPTFDFAMEQTASFLVNGICSHNTSLALHIAKEVQNRGGAVAFVDFEAALDLHYARSGIGVNTDPKSGKWAWLRPNCMEEGCNIVDRLIDKYEETKIDCIIMDSVKAMIPRVVMDGLLGDEPPMALQARKMGQWLSRITKKIKDTGTVLVLLNQMSKNIKTNMWAPGGEYETAGGLAIRFYATQRIELKQVSRENTNMINPITNKEEEMPTSVSVRASILKNKIGTPYRRAEFYIKYGGGIDNKRSIIEMAINHGVIKQGGSWFSYNEDAGGFRLQGEETMRAYLLAPENKALLKEILDKIIFKQSEEVKEEAKRLEEEEKKEERRISKKLKPKEEKEETKEEEKI